MQHTATHCNILQHTATHCNTLQHAALHCYTLQHTATRPPCPAMPKRTYSQLALSSTVPCVLHSYCDLSTHAHTHKYVYMQHIYVCIQVRINQEFSLAIVFCGASFLCAVDYVCMCTCAIHIYIHIYACVYICTCMYVYM